MLSSMSNGVTIDGEGKIVTCNKSGLKVFKTPEKDLISLCKNFFKEKIHGFRKNQIRN